MREVIFILTFSALSLNIFAQNSDTISIQELEIRISRLLEVNDIPAIGLALIDNQGNRLAKAFGQTNIEEGTPATANTMFRLGSISKMFAALAVLKLRDEGKLRLSDNIGDIIPEIEFANPWAETHPIKIQHLLNHTTGWDDIHGIEWSSNDPRPLTTKEGLDLHPHTRTSRWAPGTRMSYSNIGAPVAAYIVEKNSGMSYEQYVREYFFKPMGLKTTSFLYSDDFEKLGVTNYRQGKALDYYHISGRAAGALNSSPNELLKILDFFLKRGIVDSTKIIASKSIVEMETLVPEFGLQNGYGLCNFTSVYKGFAFKGHIGAIDNALATFYYLPEYQVGYALMTSSMQGRDFRELNKLITDYLIRNLELRQAITQSKPSLHNPEITGYYYFASPRNEKFKVIENLFEPARITWRNDTLYFGPAFGKSEEKFIAVGNNTYASENSPRALHYKEDHDGSMILYKAAFEGAQAFKPISGLLVYGKILVFGLAMLLSFVMGVLFLIQLIRLLVGRIKLSGELTLGLGPVLCSIVLLPTIVLFLYVLNNPFDYLFTRNSLTMILFVLSLVYGLLAIWSVLYFAKNWPKIIGDAMNMFLAIAAITHFLLALYLFSQGMIGIQTWT